MNLYSTYAKEFSNTRQAPWKGWERVVQLAASSLQQAAILDLGCGNGRFLKYLINNSKLIMNNYLGIDSSEELLEIAKEEAASYTLQAACFKKVDLENLTWNQEIPDKYNLITAFGLMHHLQTFESRRNILKYSSELLEKEGLLAVTYWQFAKLPRYAKKLSPLIKGGRGDSNDYLMTFGDNGAERFCHFCDDEEIKKLEEGLELERVEEYYSDGKENDQNLYIIYKIVS